MVGPGAGEGQAAVPGRDGAEAEAHPGGQAVLGAQLAHHAKLQGAACGVRDAETHASRLLGPGQPHQEEGHAQVLSTFF